MQPILYALTKSLLIVSLFSLTILPVHADAEDTDSDTSTSQVSTTNLTETALGNNVYWLAGLGGNTLFIVGPESILISDNKMATAAESLLAAIRKRSDKPIQYIINTHHHSDHTGNNQALANQGGLVIAHDHVHKHLLQAQQKTPDISFNDQSTLYFGDLEIELHHLPNAHTDGDILVYLPELNILHTGDILFNGLYPFIDLENGGTVDGYIAAMEKVVSLSNEQTIIIPGHGPQATLEDLQTNLRMLKDARSAVAILVDEGHSEKKVLQLDPLLPWHENYAWEFIDGEQMTRTLYQGLKAK